MWTFVNRTWRKQSLQRSSVLLLLAAPLFSCTSEAEQTARVICGFADVLIAETDLSLINQAFGGDDTVGTKACTAVRAYIGDTATETGEPEPFSVSAPTPAGIELPDGKKVNVILEPPT